MCTADDIVSKARDLGYDRCGIIPVEKMRGYGQRLADRIQRFPETKVHYERFYAFADPQKVFPWAQSVIICARWYGKYHIPENVRGRIAKFYLADARKDPDCRDYQDSIAFEQYLSDCGFTVRTNRDFGITALRWAALQAGIGMVRKNNFFYTEKGSWLLLEAFLIDRELEYTLENTVKPCPENCSLCVKACPTGALAEPYMTNRSTCISCLTTWEGWDLTADPHSADMGGWIYGCDACQDVCPFNRSAWSGDEAYPGLEALCQRLSPEQIVQADHDFLSRVLQPKLWYIPRDKVWRYKTNALNAMRNTYRPEYLPVIREACNDADENVRKMAAWVLSELNPL